MYAVSCCVMWMFRLGLACLVAGLLSATTATVQAQEDDDFPTGLLAEYTSGSQAVKRVDSVIAFDWNTAAPDSRLAEGPFTAQWSGNLLARLPGQHTFHAMVGGKVTVLIDDQPVLVSAGRSGFVSGQAFDLSAGDHTIRIEYQSPASVAGEESSAKLAVYWSSDQFTLEPLPADVLFRDEGSPQQNAEARGHVLMDANRCAACHRSDTHQQIAAVSTLKAPALDRINGSQDRLTLIQRLWRPQHVVANSHMPNFNLTPLEAENVAEFLLSVSKKAHAEKAITFKDGDVSAGTKLLNSMGCVACHQLPGTDENSEPLAAPYDAPELTHVAQRRSPGWLDRWLRAPETLNADHRMPIFDLTSDERRQIVAALAQTGGKATSWAASATQMSQKDRIADGKRIVQAANCAACHTIPGIEASYVAQLTADSFEQTSNNCIHATDTPNTRSEPGKRVPSFSKIVTASSDQQSAGMATTDAQAIQQYVKSRHAFSSIGVTDQGNILLARNGCVACHDRDLSRGLSSIANSLQNAHPDLSGQSQGLIPPSLTAVGDKLNDDYLRKAVAGEQKDRRLPWLLVRMPKFRHSDADRAALVQHLVTADRIPDAADGARQDVLAHLQLDRDTKATTEELLLGNQLTGAGGFNCVACHQAGGFEPRNVALGTRGSDIMTMGARLRPRFFQRWMHNPIRVVAGIEMPALKKAMPDVLDGSLPKQIAVMWKALSDSRFVPPTVTSRFEQVVNVAPGEQPRIIRDVFTIGLDRKREAVPRAFAVGFDNGHSLLMDLDTAEVRLWTIGEFARQRTEGKSWYWDMPGTVVSSQPSKSAGWQLHSQSGDRFLPVVDEGRAQELLSYRLLPSAIEITSRSWFDTSKPEKSSNATTSAVGSDSAEKTEPHFTISEWKNPERPLQAVVIRETLSAVVNSTGTGWKRNVQVLECPPGHRLQIRDTDLLAHSDAATLDVQRTFAADAPLLEVGQHAALEVTTGLRVPQIHQTPAKPLVKASADEVTSTPGFTGQRLPINRSIMPTAMAWLPDGRMAFTSLKGHVWIAADTDNDGLVDSTSLFEEGLAAPFGILADADGSIIVSHKPEILKLTDTTGDGKADLREVVASGWGYNDNYHDWASGLVRDDEGNMYVGLGSDYSQKNRPEQQDRWRGGVIKIDPSGNITPLAMSMRYPMGLALDAQGNLFATDNQGVQNTFNEINHIQLGRHYGVPSRHQATDSLQEETPAVAVPHPWTRSVNSIVFLPEDFAIESLRGHGIGCEYDSRFLMRFTVQNVDGTLQGASYRFSRPNQEAGGTNFIGPICSAIGPDGGLYIGSIWDSGWQGGQNTGGITRLMPAPNGLPNGIREVTAVPGGFEITFFHAIDREAATNPASWSVQGYTRKWGGSYATPDSGRHTLTAEKITVGQDATSVRLSIPGLKANHLYDLAPTGTLTTEQPFWPAEAHYWMKVLPD